MTYKKLMQIIQNMDKQDLERNVTVYVTDTDDYYPVTAIDFANSEYCDILDNGHPYMIADTPE